jgi:hypothetical protein
MTKMDMLFSCVMGTVPYKSTSVKLTHDRPPT